MSKNHLLYAQLLICLMTLNGCWSVPSQPASLSKRELIAKKKEKFNTLSTALANQTIQKGTSSSQVKEMFGEPDEIFDSGSTSGHFEIWTYEQVLDKTKEDKWYPVHLYFDNKKLMDWSY